MRGRASSSACSSSATGDARTALAQMREALRTFPGYAFALDGMAQAQAALGRLRTAIRYERDAVDRVPLPQYVASSATSTAPRAGRRRRSASTR